MKVQDILTDEAHWTKGAFARLNGAIVSNYMTGKADCFCLWGAVERVYGENSDQEQRLRDRLQEIRGSDSIAGFNDNATFPEVRALIEELDI